MFVLVLSGRTDAQTVLKTLMHVVDRFDDVAVTDAKALVGRSTVNWFPPRA